MDSLANNLERIRYLYREAVIRVTQEGYRFRPSLTPRELQEDVNRWRQGQGRISEQLVLLYEQARLWAGEEPSDKEIEQLRSRLQERKP